MENISPLAQGRELLSGVLVVQLGFASAEQVVAAAAEWAATRGAKSLLTMLVERRALGAEQAQMVSGLMGKALELHGNDAAKVFDSLSPAGKAVARKLATNEGKDTRTAPDKTFPSGDHKDPVDSLEGVENVCSEVDGRYDVALGPGASVVELGRGGIGRVVVAYDSFMGREVALKELLPTHAPGTPGTASTRSLEQRFLREARLTGQLEHPAIVPLFEVTRRRDGTLYYTMQRVRGRTLADALDSAGSLSKRLEYLPSVLTICQAVAYAHSRGVVHRDVKPQNVMLGPYGRTYLLDWGLARVRGKEDPRGAELKMAPDLTGSQVVPGAIGTPSYMSPEQAQGHVDDIDERSDVWGLGAVLYQLVTGRPPYDGQHAMEVVAKILRDPLVPADTLEPKAPKELLAIISKCTQKERGQRYPSAAQVAQDLEAYLTGRYVSAHAYSSWELVKRFVERKRAPLMVAAAAMVILGGFGLHSYRTLKVERDQARSFARVFVHEVADHLEPQPESRELVEKLINRSLEYYQQSASVARSREERLDTASGAWRLGQLAYRVGRTEEAERVELLGFNELEPISPAGSLDAEVLGLKAQLATALADAAADRSKPEEQQKWTEIARGVIDDAHAHHLDHPDLWEAESRIFTVSALSALDRGDTTRAKTDLEVATESATRLYGARPNDQVAVSLARLLASRGSIEQTRGELDAAKVSFQRVLSMLEPVHERSPGNGRVALNLAEAHYFIGAVDREIGVPTTHLKTAQEQLAAFLKRDPEDADAMSMAAATHFELAEYAAGLELTMKLKDKGLNGYLARLYPLAEFLSGNFAQASQASKELTADGEGQGLLFGAMSEGMLKHHEEAAQLAQKAAKVSVPSNLIWVYQRVGEVAASKGSGPEEEAVAALCAAVDAATKKNEPAAMRKALEEYSTAMSGMK
ncbi:MAG: serine/threonine-protein kinase [Myxococcaceae bacterium]